MPNNVLLNDGTNLLLNSQSSLVLLNADTSKDFIRKIVSAIALNRFLVALERIPRIVKSIGRKNKVSAIELNREVNTVSLNKWVSAKEI